MSARRCASRASLRCTDALMLGSGAVAADGGLLDTGPIMDVVPNAAAGRPPADVCDSGPAPCWLSSVACRLRTGDASSSSSARLSSCSASATPPVHLSSSARLFITAADSWCMYASGRDSSRPCLPSCRTTWWGDTSVSPTRGGCMDRSASLRRFSACTASWPASASSPPPCPPPSAAASRTDAARASRPMADVRSRSTGAPPSPPAAPPLSVRRCAAGPSPAPLTPSPDRTSAPPPQGDEGAWWLALLPNTLRPRGPPPAWLWSAGCSDVSTSRPSSSISLIWLGEGAEPAGVVIPVSGPAAGLTRGSEGTESTKGARGLMLVVVALWLRLCRLVPVGRLPAFSRLTRVASTDALTSWLPCAWWLVGEVCVSGCGPSEWRVLVAMRPMPALMRASELRSPDMEVRAGTCGLLRPSMKLYIASALRYACTALAWSLAMCCRSACSARHCAISWWPGGSSASATAIASPTIMLASPALPTHASTAPSKCRLDTRLSAYSAAWLPAPSARSLKCVVCRDTLHLTASRHIGSARDSCMRVTLLFTSCTVAPASVCSVSWCCAPSAFLRTSNAHMYCRVAFCSVDWCSASV
mmetsp:Transcript_35558/g.89963  ORF Transcript_35558/g.89963 Transcript_35558/m.89963 type:complete len:587 (-) Transcript_35558:1845-3605(-)